MKAQYVQDNFFTNISLPETRDMGSRGEQGADNFEKTDNPSGRCMQVSCPVSTWVLSTRALQLGRIGLGRYKSINQLHSNLV